MSPVSINCDCGHVVEAEDEAALLRAARRHIADRHPELVGRLSDDDLRRMAQRPAPGSG